MDRKEAKVTKRDVWEAFPALAVLTAQQFADSSVALYLGRTFRRVRAARDEIDADRRVLVESYGIKQEDGGYAMDPDGSVRLRNAPEFEEKWRDMLKAPATVDIYPVRLDALLPAGAKPKCKECKRPMSAEIAAVHLDVLVHIGAITVPAEQDDEKGDDE